MGKMCQYYNIRGLKPGYFQCKSPNCSDGYIIAGGSIGPNYWNQVEDYCQNNAFRRGNGKTGFFGRSDMYCKHHPNPQRQ